MRRPDDLLSQLTLEEKVALVSGRDFMSTNAVERLGIGRMWVTDGPHGARGRAWGETTSVAIPCTTALGATWDVELVEAVGRLMGHQVRSKGATLLLGPTMNIHRSPLAGRNFECYSEDPYMSARLAVAYVRGLQSVEGVGACIKHFVCNDSEFERMTISSEVDERTLREVYLVPFEACVLEGQAWAVMAAYNKLNGTYCAEHPWLLKDLLRGEWGFDGIVVSDWWGAKSTEGSALAGLDLEMPGPPVWFGEALLGAVREGRVPQDVLDEKVGRLLRVLERGGRLADPADTTERALDRPEDRELVRRAGAESVVLLKNERSVLPLRNFRSLAVVGPYADVCRFGGGGSSEVIPHYTVSPLEGLRGAFDGDIRFARGDVPYTILPALPPRLRETVEVDFYEDLDGAGTPSAHRTIPSTSHRWIGNIPLEAERFFARMRTTFHPDRDGEWTFGLLAAGRARLLVDGELVVDNWTEIETSPVFFGLGTKERRGTLDTRAGRRHELVVEYRTATSRIAALHLGCLPPLAPDPIAEAVAAAQACDATVVVVGLDPEQETEGRDRESMGLPGGQDELVRAVARATPNLVVVVNTGSVVSLPWSDEVPAILQAFYGGQEQGNALADVLLGKVNACGKLPTTIPARYEDHPAFANYPGGEGVVRYEEGVFVGYRHYDTRKIEPRFPFGHGLSYTTFAYSDLRITGRVVEVDVTNTGSRRGKEVVQLYVRDVASSVPRPDRELKAFAKVDLEPGETATVRFALDDRAFQYWRDGWVLEPGIFEILCGSSSRDIRAQAQMEVP